LSTKVEQLEWRRSKVIELRARGLSQTEIARELQVSKASISLDMQYLREQAKGTIKEYATDHLPQQYQVCLVALDMILSHAYEILQTFPFVISVIMVLSKHVDTNTQLQKSLRINKLIEKLRHKYSQYARNATFFGFRYLMGAIVILFFLTCYHYLIQSGHYSFQTRL
jgi:predicted transcriptional regulator